MALLGGHFDHITDPRRGHRKLHTLNDIFALVLCAITAGAADFVAIEAFGRAKIAWLRQFVPLTHGIPSHDTLARVFSLIDRDHFEAAFARWTAQVFDKTNGQIIAIDGKRLRRAHDAAEPMITVVSAWAVDNAIALGCVATQEHEGEIADAESAMAIPRLLALLDVSGCIVTTDAAGCQSDIAKQITEGEGDYVLTVKGNQKGLHEACQRWLFEATHLGEVDAFETIESGHGRHEHRRYWSARVPLDASRRALWPGLDSVGLVESRRSVGGKTTIKQRYFATSLPADAESLARAVRGHWGVENGLHWRLDVSFREDESRARVSHAAANLAVVRRISVTLLKQESSGGGGVQTRRMRAAWDERYLAKVLQLE